MADEREPEMGDEEQQDQTGTEPQDSGEVPDPAELQAELERTRKALADANKEAASRRKRLEALEADAAERKKAEMTESERLKQQVAELEKRATEAEAGRKQALVRAAVIAQATAQGFRDPEDALRYLDTSEVEIAEDGKVGDVSALLKELGTQKPYLLQPQGSVGATNPGRGQAQGETPDQRRARLFGSGGSDLGPGAGYVPLRQG
jgi:seryl-tRNA synthetase